MSQGKRYTFQRQGLENTIISVSRGQGKSGNFFSKACIHPVFIALKIGKNGSFRTFDLCTLFVLSLGEVLHDPATAFCSPGIECATAPSLSSN